jgi:shikimate dehydrogenase
MAAPAPVYRLDDLRRWPEVTRDVAPPLRLAVIGDPVAHSASPPMHNAALAALGIDVGYTRLHLCAEEVAEALPWLAKQGFIGINCTIPHKTTVAKFVDVLDPSAQRAGGVNTVVVGPDGRLTGHSTDGPGLSRAVREAFAAELSAQRVAVLGAGGGAGRAVAMQCAFEGSSRIALLNRTLEKIEPLAAEIRSAFPACEVVVADLSSAACQRQSAESDLIINCTALGMKPDDLSPIAAEALHARQMVYDTIYTTARTPAMRAADQAGARSANGLGMLLHQGAFAFEIWFQREAPVAVMRDALLAAART